MPKTYKEYNFQELISKDEKTLLLLKKEKQQELYDLRQIKGGIITNILSLQGLIQIEKDNHYQRRKI